LNESKPRWDSVLGRMRPELASGGFPRDSTAISFYSRVNAMLQPDMVLVELGAGRGGVFQENIFSEYFKTLAKMQGKVKKVIGLDVDEAIAEHPYLDERHVITANGSFPLADGIADILLSDWTFEHVEDPQNTAGEIERVLKPGGWLCARTPNKWGYVGMGSRFIPNGMHVNLLKQLSPKRKAFDVFPVAYKLNTVADLKKHFPASRWSHHSFVTTNTPRFYGSSPLLFSAIDFYQTVAPSWLKTDLIIMIQKRPDAT
jgi:SAM-dependent methyltransferase